MKSKKKRSNDAVSDIIGTVLMLGMAISLIALVYISVLSYPFTPSPVSADLIGSVDGNSIIIEHHGGDALGLDTELVITVGGNGIRVTVEDYLDDESKADGLWNIGERVVYTPVGGITGYQVKVAVVDAESNSAILMGILQEGETTATPTVTTLAATDITNTSAKLQMNYNFKIHSGSVRFTYKSDGGSWTNTSWVSKSGSGSYSETISDLSPYMLHYFKAQLRYDSTEIEGEMLSFIAYLLETSVDTISPYTQTSSPLTVTATGDSGLDNVTLWYRYSTDNSSWGTDPNWWNNSWRYYRTIIIDHTKISENLVNFPVLVKINSTIGTKCDNGNSIRFIGTDNSTEYYYEIEKWNSSGDSYVWVNITSVSSTVYTSFLMYYNNSGASDNQNPSNVWDTNYVGVWHLSETSGTHYDSTSNNHDSSTVVGVTQDATGKTDGGDSFDGSNDYIDITMNLPSTVTISTWAKSTASTLADMLWCIDSDNHGPDLFFYSGVISLNTWNGAGNPFCSIPSDVDEWHLYSTVIQSGNTNLYIDGQLCGSASYRNPTGSDFHISSSAGYDWEGSIDEVRVSNIARNSSWINACFQNQNDISSFLTIESEQSNNAGSNWTNYGTDASSPWQWSFNFPNSTGYYEFYSMGMYNDETENAPVSADAMCYYNPSVSLDTSVDAISPYTQTFSPFTITATGDSGLDNVTLYYRWSEDNWMVDWTTLTYDDFEGVSDFTGTNYTDGGGDCSLYSDGTYAHQGSNAADIQDNSGDASSFYHTLGIDVDTPGYTQIKVDFWFYADGMGSGHDFWVQYFDGNDWNTVADYDEGVDFVNGQFYHEIVWINESDYTFPSDMKIKFICDANNNNNDVYIDEIYVNATAGLGSSTDWDVWNDGSNPDTNGDDGWSWEFDFPNSVGYYEFYSIGMYSGNAEDAPSSADAICKYEG